MSQPLGDAVLDLTADLGPLSRKLAEAQALTERALGSMSRSVDQFSLRVTGMGQALDRGFLSPTAKAFDRLALATSRFGAQLQLLENTVHATGRSFADLGAAANVMATDVGHALADIRRDAELTAGVIAATSDAERKAIDSVTAAYLLQSMAAKAAQRDAIGAARASANRLVPGYSVGDTQRAMGLSSARELMVVGAKGRSDPGGINNPIVTVIEASQFANLGSRAAAIAFSNMLPHVQSQIAQQIQAAVGPPQPLAQLASTVTLDSGQYAGLITAIVASNTDSSTLAALLASRRELPQLPQSTGNNWVMYGAPGSRPPIAQIPQSTSRDFIMASGGGRDRGPGMRPVLQPGNDPLLLEMAAIRGLLSSAAQSHRNTIVMPGSVASSRGFAALPAPGDTTSVRGEGFTVTPRSSQAAAAANYQDWLRAAEAQQAAASAEQDAAHAQEAAAAAGGAGRGGGRRGNGPVYAVGGGGRGGGWGPVPGPGDQSFGDGAGRRYDFYYHRDPNSGAGGGGGGSGILSKLLWGGGGRVGIGRWGFGAGAGLGSIGSLAGFGPEHILMTGLGIAGSAATALGGAGLLGLGALGTAGVGSGADAFVGASTIADTKTLGTALTQLNTAVVQYGKNSKQAAAAQSNLNLQMKLLGDTVGVKAELQLAKNGEALDSLFDKTSGPQRVLAADIGEQAVTAGTKFLPIVLQAAGRNLAIINQDIKPFFAWLEGPQGIGIFHNLENNFASDLPTAIHAFTQSLELVLRVTSLASNYTGGFVTMLDRLASKGNALSNSTLNTWIGKMVGDFRTWEMFVKALGVALADLFKQDAGTGSSIIVTLTGMLDKLAQWEKSTRGSSQLHNIFEVHKQEVLQLLQLLPLLTSGFGGFYLKVAPAFTKAATGMISALVQIVDQLTKLGPVVDNLLVIGLLAAKLKILGPALSAVAGAIGWVTTKEGENTPVASADAAATGRLAEAQAADDLAARGSSAGVPELILPTGVRAAEGAGTAAEGDAAPLLEEAGGAGLLAKLGASKFGFGSMGTSLASKIPFLSEEGAASLAPLLSGVLAGGGGIFAGSLIQHAAHLRGGTAATLGTGATGALIGGLTLGPLGAAIGGAIGATLGPTIVHALAGLIGDTGHSPNYAQRQARATTHVTSGLQSPAAVRQQQAHLQQLAHTYQVAQENAGQHAAPRTSDLTGFGSYQNRITSPTASDIAAAKTAAFNYGKAAAQSVNTGLQSVRFPSTGLVSQRFLQELAGLPAAARPEAAKTMVAFAEQLQQSGQLPRHAVATIINLIEANFPSLATSLGGSANRAAQAVATAMKMTDALQNTKTVTANLTTEFGNIFATGKLNSDNLLTHVSSDFLQLKDNLGGMTKSGRQAAQQQMSLLRSTAIADATAMEQTVSLKMGMMSKNIASGSASAAQSAQTNFQAFSQSVATAMSDGTLATSKGVTLIAEALNSELKALGAKTIPIAILSAMSPHELLSESTFLNKGQAGTITKRGAHAVGGLVQIGGRGQAGRDTVPLNVAGQQIVVGAGEQVAVFNRHQQPIVDRALAREGYAGLGGLFDSVQTPNYMASGGMVKHGGATAQIKAPKISGGGTVSTLVSSGLQKVTQAANAMLGRMAPKLSGGVSGAGLSGSLIEIVHEIAKRMGWGGALIQDWLNVIGVESGGSMTATNSSSGAYGIAQMNTGTGVAAAKAKYYSYGGNPNTMVGQLVAMANYMKDTYGGPAGAWASEETRHSYATGGLPLGGKKPSLAEQAFVQRNKHGHHKPAQKSKRVPRRRESVGAVNFAKQGKSPILGAGGPFPFDPTDLGQIQGLLNLVLSLDGGDSASGGPTLGVGTVEGSIGKLWDLINWNTNTYWPSQLFPSPNFSSIASPGDFIISTDANGNPITPYVSPNLTQAFGASGNPAGVVGQLNEAIGWQSQGIQQMYSTLGLSHRIPKLIADAIRERVRAIAKIRARIQENLKKIKELKRKIKQAKAKIAKAQKQRPPYPNPTGKKAKVAAEKQANAAFALQRDQQVNAWNIDIRTWQQGLSPLEAENQILMGSGGANGQMGTKGELGSLNTQLGTAASTNPISILEGGSSSTGLYGLLSTVQAWPTTLNGTGGDIPNQKLLLSEWQQDLAALSPGSIQQTLTATQAGTGGTSGSSAVDQLLAQQNQLLSEQVAVSQAQYSVFAGLPPFGGSFAEGGIVPGPPGAARLIEAHGGEVVTPDGGGGGVHVHIGAKNAGWLNDLIDVRIEKSGRNTTRRVVRRLPSAGGGKLAKGQI